MAAHDHEFDEVAWIALDEAKALMRHETERQIVARARPGHRAHAAPHDGGRLMRRTSLYDRHAAAGARLIEFGGWEMPVQYTGILEEHRAVRQAAGLFDLSHMGELWVRGPEAAAALAFALVSDPGRLAVGRAQYSLICAPDGGIIDDLIVYRLADERFLVVPNASNREVVDRGRARATGRVRRRPRRRLAAHRADRRPGPARPGASSRRSTDADLDALRYYAHHRRARVAGIGRLDRAHRLHRRGRLRAVRGVGRRAGPVGQR